MYEFKLYFKSEKRAKKVADILIDHDFSVDVDRLSITDKWIIKTYADNICEVLLAITAINGNRDGLVFEYTED